MRDQPWYRLTRHFFNALFDFGFLSDAGVQGFTRLLLGIAAAFIAQALILFRLFLAKYSSLAGGDTAEPFLQAVLSDYAFALAVPMWVVAFVTVLVGHALFPDETDFRVLMALPVTRRLVFGAKLLALIAFTAMFAFPVHIALSPLFFFMSASRWAEHNFVLQLVAFETVNVIASAWAVLAVAAMQGLVVLYAPRGRVFAVSAALRSVMLCGLMLSLTFVARLPAMAPAIVRNDAWLRLVPPMWFLGIERWLVGEDRPHLLALAAIGAAVFAATAALATFSYVFLYRRFDRVMHRPVELSPPSWAFRWRRPPLRLRRPVLTAMRHFAAVTLRRSVLHQGLVVVLSAVGAGLVVNSLVSAGVLTWWRTGVSGARLQGSAVWGSFALIYVAALAVRVALVVPIEVRANWVFRMIEQGAERVDQLAAAPHMAIWFGVVAPAALLLPLQWAILGPKSVGVFLAAMLCGWLFVEILLKDWARIPFTCSYVPGKGFVPQMILKALGSFVVFTTLGTGLGYANMSAPKAALVANATLVTIATLLRRRRLRAWTHTTLEFEDQLPTETSPLVLH